MSLGKIIRHRREELGLTQDQVAGQVGISKPYLSNIETHRAKNPPTDGVLENLERALCFEHGQLLRIAHFARTPLSVRQEHDHLEAAVQKYRSALRQLLANANGEGRTKLQALLDQADADGNVTPIAAGVNIPVINKVAAGYPHHFTDLDYPPSVADEYIRCPDLHDAQAFAARVVGDSMVPDFCEGDIVVFSPNTALRNGDDCFVRFDDGETTFKRVYQDDADTIRLQPLNSLYRAEVHRPQRITGLWPAVFRIQRLTRR